MLTVFGAALALAYAAVPSLPAAVVALAAALHLPTSWLTRRANALVATAVQAPLALGAFAVLRQLARGHFAAVPASTHLAAALRAGSALRVAGVDLTLTGAAALAASPIAAGVVVALVVGAVVAGRLRAPRPHPLLSVLPVASAMFLPLLVTVFVVASAILRAVTVHAPVA